VKERTNYIGSILANFGQGPSQGEKAAVQIDSLLYDHNLKMRNFVREREKLLDSTKNQPPLTN